MIQSHVDLARLIETGELVVDPFAGKLQPASVDLRLGRRFKWFDTGVEKWGSIPIVDLSRPIEETLPPMIEGEADSFIMEPGKFALGHTLERVALGAGSCARVEGRSSIGRLGMIVHVTAGFIDPGFNGQITLELYNLSPYRYRLQAGQTICQLAVEALQTPAERPYGHPSYGSKYQGQMGVTSSRWRGANNGNG
jgi:dCTP deaminase